MDELFPERRVSTTTIRLSDELKARIVAAAKREGISAHNFMLEAVAEKADLAERRTNLDAEADRRYARILETGETIAWEDMRKYLEDRVAGRPARRPEPHKLA
ncbi:MAG: CopG family transcriptional regulator [Rhodanobacteraceae bacterium]